MHESSSREWELYRLDDNANEIPVARFARRDDAERARVRYAASGHKQIWLIRRTDRHEE